LPGWRSSVTVPISTWPNPSAAAAGQARAFLSKPAAKPTALGKLSPKHCTGRVAARGSRVSTLEQPAGRRHPAQQGQRIHAQFVRMFGIKPEQCRTDEFFVEMPHGADTETGAQKIKRPNV
jgi:hypothetical protein